MIKKIYQVLFLSLFLLFLFSFNTVFGSVDLTLSNGEDVTVEDFPVCNLYENPFLLIYNGNSNYDLYLSCSGGTYFYNDSTGLYVIGNFVEYHYNGISYIDLGYTETSTAVKLRDSLGDIGIFSNVLIYTSNTKEEVFTSNYYLNPTDNITIGNYTLPSLVSFPSLRKYILIYQIPDTNNIQIFSSYTPFYIYGSVGNGFGVRCGNGLKLHMYSMNLDTQTIHDNGAAYYNRNFSNTITDFDTLNSSIVFSNADLHYINGTSNILLKLVNGYTSPVDLSNYTLPDLPFDLLQYVYGFRDFTGVYQLLTTNEPLSFIDGRL